MWLWQENSNVSNISYTFTIKSKITFGIMPQKFDFKVLSQRNFYNFWTKIIFILLRANKSFNLLNGRTWEIRCKDVPLAPKPRPIGPKLSPNTIKDRLTFLAFLQLLIWWISQYQKKKNDNHVVIWAKTFFIHMYLHKAAKAAAAAWQGRKR